MENRILNDIKSLSLAALAHVCARDPSFVLPYLHPDVTWIRSLDNQALFGREAVAKALASFSLVLPDGVERDVRCRLSVLPHRQSAAETPASTGTAREADMVCATITVAGRDGRNHYCATLLWEITDCTLQILHVHASLGLPEWAQVASSGSGESRLRLFGMGRECYYLLPAEILFAEADNIYTFLGCRNHEYHVRHPLAQLEEILPVYFFRVHRRFLVNLHEIQALFPHGVCLSNGIELPVSDRNFGRLEEHLNRLCQKPDASR